MARKKIKSATDQRKFTLVYNDFLESDLLNHYEKSVFIALKKYADNDTMRAFPSLNKLHKITGISLSQVRRSIDHMKELGVISVEHRTDEDKGHQSNLYTLYDYAEIWSVGSSEDIAAVANEISEMKLVAELRSRGYTVTKEKGLDNEPTKAHYQAPQLNQFDIVNTTTNSGESQDLERYTLDQIKQLFDYDIMIQDNPYRQQDIDSVMNILYTTMNTTKATIRIAGEDKPSMIVVGKLMKLSYSEIMYAIEKYQEQTERIKNPTSYMLTLLYNSKEQMNLDITNQVSHDMAHWNTEE
jgi:DNA-binding Lrp family transcriptional regulator